MMRLRNEGGQEYWELSPEEVERRRQVFGMATSDKPLPATCRLDAGSELPIAVPPIEISQWREEHAVGVELHPWIAEQLRSKGCCIFPGALVRVSSALALEIEEVRGRFTDLSYPTFGHHGATGFFAGRQLLSYEASLAPGKCDIVDDGDGFLASLIKATIRSLPDYDPSCTYPLSWMLTRHNSSVEAMPFHHDRVGWLAQFNIDRTPGVHGGSVQLRNLSGQVTDQSALKDFLDGYIVRDSDFAHGVTAMSMDSQGEDHRDIMVIRLPASEHLKELKA